MSVFGHPAKKSLSQNFLIDPNLQRKIVDALEPQPTDHVVEIGPGTGALTKHLVDRVGHLALIELDDALAAMLREEYAGLEHVEVLHADALKISVHEAAGGDASFFKLIGNIPYGITTPLIFHILEDRPRPQVMVLTVQKEVADRMVARPGTKAYGALTVGIQAVAKLELLFTISRHAFRPRPDVDSAVVSIKPMSPAPLSPAQEESFRSLTRAAFSRRRKQLQKVLRQAPEYALSGEEAASLLRSLDIDPATRPDALPVSDYVRLAYALSSGD